MSDVPYDETDAERCILYEGLTGGSLVMILNAWVGGEAAVYWNRKGAYVSQLIPAALSLLDRGLIEVWEEPHLLEVGEGSLLTSDRAAEVLADPSSWWRYDPDDDSDPQDHVRPRGEDADWEPMRTMYSVITAAEARERGITVWFGN